MHRRDPDSDETPEEKLEPGNITRLQTQRKNNKRVSIFIDGHFAFGIHQDVLLQHNLYSGLFLDAPTIQTLTDADALLRAKEAAMVYLGHRARSVHEVNQKLQQKGFNESVIKIVRDRLLELGYLNDRSFAHQFVKGRFQAKGYGPQRLRSDLYRLGLAPGLIEEVLDEELDNDEILIRAFEQGKKKWKQLRREPDAFKKRKKLFDFLLRRGHTPDVSRQIAELLEKEDVENF